MEAQLTDGGRGWREFELPTDTFVRGRAMKCISWLMLASVIFVVGCAVPPAERSVIWSGDLDELGEQTLATLVFRVSEILAPVEAGKSAAIVNLSRNKVWEAPLLEAVEKLLADELSTSRGVAIVPKEQVVGDLSDLESISLEALTERLGLREPEVDYVITYEVRCFRKQPEAVTAGYLLGGLREELEMLATIHVLQKPAWDSIKKEVVTASRRFTLEEPVLVSVGEAEEAEGKAIRVPQPGGHVVVIHEHGARAGQKAARGYHKFVKISEIVSLNGLVRAGWYRRYAKISDRLDFHVLKEYMESEVVVTSTPVGCGVFLGENFAGVTPTTVMADEGDELVLRKDGYVEERFKILPRYSSIHVNLIPELE